jgi:nicotinamide phosphoribosyltransferase
MQGILSTDSYKLSHFLQYPAQTRRVSSYIEARAGGTFDKVLVFGTQLLAAQIDSFLIDQDEINHAAETAEKHGVPFNREGWEYILEEYNGRLPLIIEALPDGMVVPVGTPMVQVTTPDDPKLAWLTSYVETSALRTIWYASTVATLSFHVKEIIWENLLKTCDDPDSAVNFMLHDFGARGVSSAESAAIGGMAHLVNFYGTDTLEAIDLIRELYNTDEMPGFSVPASEHSTMTSWGQDYEANAYANMIDKCDREGGVVSIVADSYDLYNAVENIFGGVLKDKVLGMKGRLVIRPDSGHPVTTPLRVIDRLWQIFGGHVNSKGFRVLHPKVRVLQGDGMNLERIEELFKALEDLGYSGENIVVGMGGGLLQQVNRDTLRFAMKASAIDFGGGWVDVQKNPKTDPSKASKKGRQAVVIGKDGLETVREDELAGRKSLLQPIYTPWAGACRFQEWGHVRQMAENKLKNVKQRIAISDAAA